MAKITVSGLKEMTGSVAKDSNGVILFIENFDGETFKVALNQEHFSKVISLLFRLAVETANEIAPENKQTITVVTEPVPIAQLGIGRGNTASEAILSMQVGLLRMVFSAERSEVVKICEHLEDLDLMPPPQNIQ